MQVIFELDDDESKWWDHKIKKFRELHVKAPVEYLKLFIASTNFDNSIIETNPSEFIRVTREGCWDLYIKDEMKFHSEVITSLIKEREIPMSFLKEIFSEESINDIISTQDKNEIYIKLSQKIGDFSGRVMPYFYDLSLSTTNSRRSRAGKTFEAIIEYIITEFYHYPFENQTRLGGSFYKETKLKKIVDGIIPGGEMYSTNRTRCLIITMKTTLRERWGEVVEELNRTNIPAIHLLTLDENISGSMLDTMKNHNIILVVPDRVKNEFKDFKNLMGFNDFFNKEIPHYLSYWK